MQELTADMFVSLDGFASGADGTQNWIAPYGGPDLGQFIDSVLSEPQLIVVGRVTYEALAGYWPSAVDGPAKQMNSLPKLVFSKSLQGPLAWQNSRLTKGDLNDEILTLKRESETPLRSIGSVTLVKAMLKLGLVDRLRLVLFPTILGTAGTERIFDGLDPTSLQLAASRVLDTNIVMLDYRPVVLAKAAR
jgi:dihydrofolate reductase